MTQVVALQQNRDLLALRAIANLQTGRLSAK
jgi:hypothetical protein